MATRTRCVMCGQTLPSPVGANGFRLGARSLEKLQGVHPFLVDCVHRAIRITTIDFSVRQGVRDLEMQRRYFHQGRTRTMDSRHLYGLAVDLAPYVNGRIVWTKDLFLPIRAAMFQAAVEAGGDYPLRWGGDWDSDGDMTDQDFHDRPHFEIPKSAIPNPKVMGPWTAAA